VALIGGCTAYILMGTFIPLAVRPDLVVLLALTYGLAARSIFVPSSARCTLWLGAAIGIPLVVSTYFSYLKLDAALWVTADPLILTRTPRQIAFVVALTAGVWWSLTVLVCTAASKVIYGLRREVNDIRKLGQYTLEQKLGEGGMGVVYRASHSMLRRPTAVKLLPAEKAGEYAVARFEREVQETARLTHPNTVTIYDYGRTPEGVFYYAMELLDGATLSEVVETGGPLPPARAVHILTQVAGALSEAHRAGLIHRDIKPANVMVCEQGGHPDVAKVLDFGLVKDTALGSRAPDLTQSHSITGTPQYMAPESIRAPETADQRTDLYSLGAVGYYLLTASQVFAGKSVVEVCSGHLHGEPEPPSQRLGAALPQELEQIILWCLEKQPEARPQSAAELRDRLLACRDVGNWTEDDARSWWEEHGGTLRERHRRAAATASAETLAVDLKRRRP
jgi:serine/threonine-protein kinase